MVLTEQTVYIAEDGKEFYDEDDCLSHERDLLEAKLDMYNWKFERCNFENSKYIKASTEEAVKVFLQICDMEGVTKKGILPTPGIYMYNNRQDEWFNITNAIDIINGGGVNAD
jgi:hypothetical protein